MQYSDDALYSMLGAGAVALAWGLALCWRLPQPRTLRFSAAPAAP